MIPCFPVRSIGRTFHLCGHQGTLFPFIILPETDELEGTSGLARGLLLGFRLARLGTAFAPRPEQRRNPAPGLLCGALRGRLALHRLACDCGLRDYTFFTLHDLGHHLARDDELRLLGRRRARRRGGAGVRIELVLEHLLHDIASAEPMRRLLALGRREQPHG